LNVLAASFIPPSLFFEKLPIIIGINEITCQGISLLYRFNFCLRLIEGTEEKKKEAVRILMID